MARILRWAVVGLALLAMCACNSRKAARAEERSKAAAAKAQQAPDLDLNCVVDHIQNPPEAFHYSYTKESSNPVHEEADITPQTIDGSFTNSSGTHPVHGVHSDQSSWQGAWTGLMGIAGMSSAIAIIHSGSPMVREGPEAMNGYDAVKYSIDTGRGSVEEQGLYRAVLGTGGFEKGTVWVAAKGCPVKLVMDSELHSNNGSVEKIHYDEEMVRK
jgi:hypothetical protein